MLENARASPSDQEPTQPAWRRCAKPSESDMHRLALVGSMPTTKEVSASDPPRSWVVGVPLYLVLMETRDRRGRPIGRRYLAFVAAERIADDMWFAWM